MTTVAAWLLQNAVIATIGALVLAAALPRWRIPARLEHVLWLVLAVKFLLPPLVAMPLPERVGLAVPALERVSDTHTPPSAVPGQPEATQSGGATESAADPVAGAATDAGARRGVAGILLLVWLAGGLVAFGYHLVRMAAWHRRRCPVAPPVGLVQTVGEVASAIGIRTPRVALDPSLEAPVVTGLLRPRLIWPSALAEATPQSVTRTVVAHELSHIRRGDLWVGVLELVGRCVWWWFPGWSFVERRLRDASERACDDAVIRLYPTLRRRYAEGLLDVASIAASRRPSIALGLDGPGSMRRRLRAVLSPAPPVRGRGGALALIVFSLVLLPGWSAERGGGPDPLLSAERRGGSDPLLSALRNAAADSEPEVRRAAANALREVEAPEADAVLRTLADDPDEHVRRSARAALGLEPARPNLVFPPDPAEAPPSAEELARLTAVLAQGSKGERIAAAARLGNVRDPRAVPALRTALRDPDPRVRQYSADALGAIGPTADGAASALLPLLGDPHPRVRQSAASALGHHDELRVVAALSGTLADADVHVRRVAVGALGRIAAARAP